MGNGRVQVRDAMWDAKTELYSCPPPWAGTVGGHWFVLKISPVPMAPQQNQGFSQGGAAVLLREGSPLQE